MNTKNLTNILANLRPQTRIFSILPRLQTPGFGVSKNNTTMKQIERLYLAVILTPIVGLLFILAYMAIQL
jgi:hypothetical protein